MLAILGDEPDARDTTQAVFIQAWRNLPSLRDPDLFPAWFGRIVAQYRAVIDARGGAGRVREISFAGLPDEGERVPLPATGVAHDERTASIDRLDRAFERLFPSRANLPLVASLRRALTGRDRAAPGTCRPRPSSRDCSPRGRALERELARTNRAAMMRDRDATPTLTDAAIKAMFEHRAGRADALRPAPPDPDGRHRDVSATALGGRAARPAGAATSSRADPGPRWRQPSSGWAEWTREPSGARSDAQGQRARFIRPFGYTMPAGEVLRLFGCPPRAGGVVLRGHISQRHWRPIPSRRWRRVRLTAEASSWPRRASLEPRAVGPIHAPNRAE